MDPAVVEHQRQGVLGLILMTGTLWIVRGFGWVYGRVVQAIQVARPQ